MKKLTKFSQFFALTCSSQKNDPSKNIMWVRIKQSVGCITRYPEMSCKRLTINLIMMWWNPIKVTNLQTTKFHLYFNPDLNFQTGLTAQNAFPTPATLVKGHLSSLKSYSDPMLHRLKSPSSGLTSHTNSKYSLTPVWSTPAPLNNLTIFVALVSTDIGQFLTDFSHPARPTH